MTLDEFIKSEINCGHIQDDDYFYIGLYTFKLDNGKKLNKGDYENYLEYKLKTATIQIEFDEMGRYMAWYEIELVSEDDEDEEDDEE